MFITVAKHEYQGVDCLGYCHELVGKNVHGHGNAEPPTYSTTLVVLLFLVKLFRFWHRMTT